MPALCFHRTLKSLLSVASVLFLAARLNGQSLSFQSFVPPDVLHNYANSGLVAQISFNGRPVHPGMRIVVFGPVIGRNIDSKGAFFDLKGAPSIGHSNGVVRVYVAQVEFDKLQSDDYVYIPLGGTSSTSIALSGNYIGLNRFGNLEISGGELLPWKGVLLTFSYVTSAPAPRNIPPSKPAAIREGYRFYKAAESAVRSASTVRQIDFSTFSFPAIKELVGTRPESSIVLRRGATQPQPDLNHDGYSLSRVVYGDFTNDGAEDAAVELKLDHVMGNYAEGLVFIYAIDSAQLKLLAAFGVGTAPTIVSDHGNLLIDSDGWADADPHCCPSLISRERYVWQNGTFVRRGTPQLIAKKK